MLDKIKNTIRNNIWGWSFLILFGIMGLLLLRYEKIYSDVVLMIWVGGVLLFFYGISIQKQVTWKNAIVVGAKVFSVIFGELFILNVIFRSSYGYYWWNDFRFFGKHFVIATLVYTVIACLLNLIVGRKGQIEDKKSVQKLVSNKDECEFSPKVWNWSAFITFLLIAGLAFVVEIIFLEATHKSSFTFSL